MSMYLELMKEIFAVKEGSAVPQEMQWDCRRLVARFECGAGSHPELCSFYIAGSLTPCAFQGAENTCLYNGALHG